MELMNVVDVLDEEFDIENVKDDWSFMFDNLFVRKSVAKFRMKDSNSGLLIKNSNEINKIYTAFSPSRYVLEAIQLKGVANVLLVVKHPFDWDGRKNGVGFVHFSERDYQIMESMGISIYSLHTPMDKNRKDDVMSTAYAFAKVIKMRMESEFASEPDNPGIKIGIIGKVNETKLTALVKRLNSVLDYRVKVMKVSENVGKVAIVTGGGFIPEIIQEVRDLGVNTFITGIITANASDYSRKNYHAAFSEIRKIGINVIGCSHYLTEKWAMEFSIPYFSKVCKAEFIEDKEALNILE